MKLLVLTGAVMVAAIACAPRAERGALPQGVAEKSQATTRPVLFHRTGGIAGTDDRVVIWGDGVVDVRGKVLPSGRARVGGERHAALVAMFDGWERLSDRYLAANIPDAYVITISYGEKTVAASDLAPDLPEQFRTIFAEIESIAAGAGAGGAGSAGAGSGEQFEAEPATP